MKGLKLFSRSDAITSETLSLKTEIDAAVAISNFELKNARASLTLQIDDSLKIKAPKGSLCQIVTNLLVNSAHAVEGLAERKISLTVTSLDGETLTIKVKDTGCGIETSQREKIFEPFVTFKPIGKGTGLGLSIVHGLVSTMNGRIEIESQVGVGTTFEIRLPLSANEGAAPIQPVFEQKTIDKQLNLNILIIDDEEGIRSAIGACLSGHSVKSVATLAEAYDYLAINGDAVHLVLCDMNLVSESGRNFYEALKTQSMGAADKIIFMTGGVGDEKTRHWLETIPNRILTKPFKVEDLKELIKEFAEREKVSQTFQR